MRSQPLGLSLPKDPNPPQSTAYLKLPPWKLNFPPYQTPSDIKNTTSKLIKQRKAASSARGEHPCRKIVFKFKSHDQGICPNGSNRGTYKESWTWFDVGKEELIAFRVPSSNVDLDSIANAVKEKGLASFETAIENGEGKEERIVCISSTVSPSLNSKRLFLTTAGESSTLDQPDFGTEFKHPLHAEQANCIQKNKTAISQTQRHIVTWRYNDNVLDPDSEEGKELEEKGRGRETGNGEFVRALKVGDTVTVWAKARFQSWYNRIEGAEVKVYWAV
jgi:hypothetical protein